MTAPAQQKQALDRLGLAAFVANGAVLPRASGVSDLPLPPHAGAVPFQSPENLEVEVKLPHGFTVRGMGEC
jgi:predicted ABC-class ATPase